MTIALKNSFHETHVEINTRCRYLPYRLSIGQYRRVKRELCGHRGCKCKNPSSAWYGLRRLAIEGAADEQGRPTIMLDWA